MIFTFLSRLEEVLKGNEMKSTYSSDWDKKNTSNGARRSVLFRRRQSTQPAPFFSQVSRKSDGHRKHENVAGGKD